jgi:hypothetical protein
VVLSVITVPVSVVEIPSVVTVPVSVVVVALVVTLSVHYNRDRNYYY